MNNCSQGCSQGMSAAKCVEYNNEQTVYDALVQASNDITTIYSKFNKSVDGKTLGTGQDLIATVQKLVDKEIIEIVFDNSDSISVDLLCLAGNNCNTVVTQAQLNAILIKEICYLKGVINTLQTSY